ncbi:MAG: hypothetical protein KJ879_03295 [Nanoarchaeota archaeon]|nr:hypothetical protein [Nanoarchaeota archaeon]
MGFSFYKKEKLHCKRKSKFVLPRLSKKAEVGETVTWMVATIAIVVILFISVFVSSVYFNGKKKASPLGNADYLAASSFNSWLLTKNSSGTMVYEQLKSNDDFNDFNGDLSQKIFLEFYGDEYRDVWMGVYDGSISVVVTNRFFGSRPGFVLGGGENLVSLNTIVQRVPLGEGKDVELLLRTIK